jgi:hypothetical protein
MSENKTFGDTDLGLCLGIAVIILSLCLGIGGCNILLKKVPGKNIRSSAVTPTQVTPMPALKVEDDLQ